MKYLKLIFVLLVTIVTSCSKKDSNQLTNSQIISEYSSEMCSGLTGAKALYWDSVNGIAVPLNFVPMLEDIDGQFIHSQLPYLGFQMPTGYLASEINDPSSQAIGVNVIRNDNNVVWRYIPTITFAGNVSETDIINFEINQIMAFHNSTTNPQIICTESRELPTNAYITKIIARLINFGNFTATVTVQTMFFPDLNATFSSISLVSGPKNEYDLLIEKIFLPLHWQLLIGPEGVQDSDLDGYPDEQDAEPYNPNVN